MVVRIFLNWTLYTQASVCLRYIFIYFITRLAQMTRRLFKYGKLNWMKQPWWMTFEHWKTVAPMEAGTELPRKDLKPNTYTE